MNFCLSCAIHQGTNGADQRVQLYVAARGWVLLTLEPLSQGPEPASRWDALDPGFGGKLLTHYHTKTQDHLSSNPECHLFFIYQSITIHYAQWKFKQSPLPLFKPVNYSAITNKSAVGYPFPSHSQTAVCYNMNFRGNA